MKTFGFKEQLVTVLALLIAIFMFWGGQIKNYFFPPQNTLGTETNMESLTDTSTVAGLEIYDETVGTGAEAVAGNTVTADYVGTLSNGQKFDSSKDRGQPFSFMLGAGQVIQGWDLGIQGMKVGGKRRLVISPELGYGNQSIGPIPANSTLVFEVELLKVE